MQRTILATLTAMLLLAGFSATAADWPQFLGPHGDGISRETGLLKEWPEGGPKQVWKVPLGDGYSCPSIVGDRLYTMYQDAEGQRVVAFNALTGEKLWDVPSGPIHEHMGFKGPRASPTVEGDRVYTLDAEGTLLCLKADSGETIWGFNVLEKFSAQNLQWGCSMSPVIVGDALFVNTGESEGQSIVALNKMTGETLWTRHSGIAGYATPIYANVAGKDQLVFFTGEGPLGITTDGDILWESVWKTRYDVNAAAPILLGDDKIFITSNYGAGCQLLQISADGDEPVKVLWENKDIESRHGNALLWDGYLYGNASSRNQLRCLDPADGSQKWSHRGLGEATLLIADGLCYALSNEGHLYLARLSSEGFEVISEMPGVLEGKTTWAIPVISHGRMYLRDQKHLICFDVRAAAE